ncbi:MAG: 4-hydroxy-tetrahydrodipicolinate reductase [Spirochaetia bacterium]|nr:4-hydroxy-tetrahydrodipicolinate reductase [Spirochaetia bacterium]
MISFAIVGAVGRMGQSIAKLSLSNEKLNLKAAVERADHPDINKSYGEIIGLKEFDFNINTLENLPANIEGIIDFSSAESSVKTADFCGSKSIPLVIGATGLNHEQTLAIQNAAARIPVVLSSNMSLGVNLLFYLTKKAAKTLKNAGFQPEMTEIHHKHKKDAPSGTAKTLENIIMTEYEYNKENIVYGREGITGERPENQLGSFALRGGDVVGEHTVYFFGEGERVELTHKAVSREIFASGALTALSFLQSKKSGLYNMLDVLGLND